MNTDTSTSHTTPSILHYKRPKSTKISENVLRRIHHIILAHIPKSKITIVEGGYRNITYVNVKGPDVNIPIHIMDITKYLEKFNEYIDVMINFEDAEEQLKFMFSTDTTLIMKLKNTITIPEKLKHVTLHNKKDIITKYYAPVLQHLADAIDATMSLQFYKERTYSIVVLDEQVGYILRIHNLRDSISIATIQHIMRRNNLQHVDIINKMYRSLNAEIYEIIVTISKWQIDIKAVFTPHMSKRKTKSSIKKGLSSSMISQ